MRAGLSHAVLRIRKIIWGVGFEGSNIPPQISISTFRVYLDIVMALKLIHNIYLWSFRGVIISTTPNITAIMGVCFEGELCNILMSNYLYDANTFKTLTFQTKSGKKRKSHILSWEAQYLDPHPEIGLVECLSKQWYENIPDLPLLRCTCRV